MEDWVQTVDTHLTRLLSEIEGFLSEASRRGVTYEPADVADRLLDLWNAASEVRSALNEN